MYRKTYIEINLKNLAHNVKTIVNKYDYQYYIGVVKGNAYGHGYGIINTLIKNGINFLAVALLDEALEIRKYNKDIKILCLEPINIEYLNICEKENISISINDYDYYQQVKETPYKLNIHLKLDTGMNRLGFKDQATITKVYHELNENDKLTLEGIFSHFSTPGIYDKSYDHQLESFLYLTKNIDLTTIPVVHLDRSASMVAHDKLSFVNAVRLGIIMYGFDVIPKPSKGFKGKLRNIKWNFIRKQQQISPTNKYQDLGLKQAFQLVTEVIEVKDVKEGSYIGYGTKNKAEENMKVAILDIGYADGINKKRYGSYVEINNQLYPIVADIGMGMTIVKVDKNVKKHDKVIIIGDKVSVKYVSNYLNTSAYEVMCSLDSGIERKYIDE